METVLGTFGPYIPTEELWVITVYYNPCGYKSRRSTYDTFIASMRASRQNVLTVECAFGEDSFELPEAPDVVRVRSDSLLWQKERLINIGAQYLPASCKYVAWVDCDILFENRSWAVETCELLKDSCTIVQLFESCIRLQSGGDIGPHPDQAASFAFVTTKDLSTLDCGRYDKHGHTGYGWAMRREIFDAVGLYEYAVSGSADHFMSHAIYGTYGFCVENALKHDLKQISHLKKWGDAFFALAQGKLGVVSGNIYHLWHGSLDRRDYFRRMWKITECGFNPDTDLICLPGRPLEWRPDVLTRKPALVEYFAEYFESRQEDTI